MDWNDYKQSVDKISATDDLKQKLYNLKIETESESESETEKEPLNNMKTAKKIKNNGNWKVIVSIAAACFVFGIFSTAFITSKILPIISNKSYNAAFSTDSIEPQVDAFYNEEAYKYEESYDYEMAPDVMEEYYEESAAGAVSDTKVENIEAQNISATKRKIIYTAYLNIETKIYDDTLSAINRAVTENKGYIEGSSQHTRGGGDRYSHYTFRIPAENYNNFLNSVGESGGVITNNEQSTDDITSKYIDTEARIKSYEEKLTRLYELQSKSGDLTELLQIESQIQDTMYKLDSAKSQMNFYQDEVSFCTINIDLEEVIEYTEPEESFLGEVGNAFSGGIHDFLEFCGDIIILIASSVPFLTITGITIVIIIIVVKKRKAKKQK